MKKIIISSVTCILFYSLQAQTIEGTVYDHKTRETIPGAVVYLYGTTLVTTSDRDGKFSLEVGRVINTTLEFSHLSYEPLSIEKPFEHKEKAFYLKEKVSTLSEARVVADRYSREEKIRVFKEEFLGKSIAGKSCLILNEDDIVLDYDDETNTFSGYSINPIVIENNYLAYRVTFDLHIFTIRFSQNTLEINKAESVLFKGSSFFIDQSPYNIMFAKRRKEIYLRSSQYFWKNLVAHTLEKAECRIFNRFKYVNSYQYFAITDAPSQKVVMVMPDTDLNRKHNSVDKGSIYGVIGIVSNKRFRSEAVFLTNRLSVDEFGNISAIDKVIYFGDMGEQRLGEMLPMDYTI